MANAVLLQWGLVQFRVHPLNIHELDHMTASSWAKKDVVESIPHREWTGEEDEEIRVRGRVFPYRIGGLPQLEVMNNYRLAGYPHPMIRGGAASAFPMGWFICDRLIRKHDHLSAEGVGRQINFEASFFRVDIPREPETYYTTLFNLMS